MRKCGFGFQRYSATSSHLSTQPRDTKPFGIGYVLILYSFIFCGRWSAQNTTGKTMIPVSGLNYSSCIRLLLRQVFYLVLEKVLYVFIRMGVVVLFFYTSFHLSTQPGGHHAFWDMLCPDTIPFNFLWSFAGHEPDEYKHDPCIWFELFFLLLLYWCCRGQGSIRLLCLGFVFFFLVLAYPSCFGEDKVLTHVSMGALCVSYTLMLYIHLSYIAKYSHIISVNVGTALWPHSRLDNTVLIQCGMESPKTNIANSCCSKQCEKQQHHTIDHPAATIDH